MKQATWENRIATGLETRGDPMDLHPPLRHGAANNAAEAALREVMLKRKISCLTCSRRGEEFIARSFTVLERCRRQGRNMLAFLRESITAWISQTAGPSLVPPPG